MNPPLAKRCTKCCDVFPMTCFTPQKHGRWGRRSWCKSCHRADVRRRELKKLYDLTPEQYDEMNESGCGICGRPRSAERGLHVDHDHATGAVRGVLCYQCNAALGYFQDNPELMRRGAQWVEHSGAISWEGVGI